MENNTFKVYGTDTLMIDLSEKAAYCLDSSDGDMFLIEYQTEDGLRYDLGDVSETATGLTADEVNYNLEELYSEWYEK